MTTREDGELDVVEDDGKLKLFSKQWFKSDTDKTCEWCGSVVDEDNVVWDKVVESTCHSPSNSSLKFEFSIRVPYCSKACKVLGEA